MNNSSWVWAVLVILVILGLGWWYFSMQPATTTDNSQTTTTTNTTTGQGDTQTGTGSGTTIDVGAGASVGTPVTVTLGANGFSPASVTIKKGGIVTFLNKASGDMWVASANHPTHTLYAGTALSDHCPDGSALAFDECKAGDTYSFQFDKVGTWRYHNHLNATQGGTVIVQ